MKNIAAYKPPQISFQYVPIILVNTPNYCNRVAEVPNKKIYVIYDY